jgi:hypothetical protein
MFGEDVQGFSQGDIPRLRLALAEMLLRNDFEVSEDQADLLG